MTSDDQTRTGLPSNAEPTSQLLQSATMRMMDLQFEPANSGKQQGAGEMSDQELDEIVNVILRNAKKRK